VEALEDEADLPQAEVAAGVVPQVAEVPPADQHAPGARRVEARDQVEQRALARRSEEHTSELQSRSDIVCRLLLEKKKQKHHPSSLSPNTHVTTPTPPTSTLFPYTTLFRSRLKLWKTKPISRRRRSLRALSRR